MRFPEPISVQTLAARYEARIIGDATLMATGINEIHKVQPGDIAFSDVRKYFEKTLKSAATVILLNEETDCPPGKVILVVDNPFHVYDDIVRSYRPFQPVTQHFSPDNDIHPSVIIEPGVVIAHDVKIGANTHICANAVIGPHTVIGEHVVVGPGALIGPDAFYFKKMPDGEMIKWRSGGRVILEDHVDIGAGCTISKGVSGDTIIGRGSKLDCQVHIGHGVVVGKNCLFAAQVGIGGKTVIGDQVVLYGQTGVAQAIEIGSGAVVLAKSGVSKSLEGGKTYFGIPADEVREKYRELASLRLLPELMKKKGTD